MIIPGFPEHQIFFLNKLKSDHDWINTVYKTHFKEWIVETKT